MAAMALITNRAAVVVFIPPPVEPGATPMTISSIRNTTVGTANASNGRVLKPAVRAVTDWNKGPSQQIEPEQESLITIRADEKVFHGQVVEVMDILRSIDGARIGMATKPKASE